MKPCAHLIVFAKAPRLGAVKTRLARDVGAVQAVSFCRSATTALLRRVGDDPRWNTLLAVSPDRDADAGRFWPHGFARRRQGRGDLGQRMERALKAPPPGPAVLIGNDIPDVAARHIARAFDALGDHDAVFGPASDGGFWLVGFRRRPWPNAPFANVRWSGPHALADTLANLAGRRVAMVDELNDIDTGADLAAWRKR